MLVNDSNAGSDGIVGNDGIVSNDGIGKHIIAYK